VNDLLGKLADLHGETVIGELVKISFPASLEGRIDDLVTGGGFELVSRSGREVTMRRARSLPDHVGPDMTLLVCGLNPSLYAADRGVNFARPGNRFWPAMLAAGLVTVDRDPRHALVRHGVGMTDLVKRATVAAAELTAEEFVAGVARVERLCAWLRPRALCVVGLSGWRAAVDRKATVGWQPAELGGVPVYVMPNTSGLNASTQHGGFVTHLRAAARGPGARARGSGS
jgi:double-stranded uracil-DNA glycosylase